MKVTTLHLARFPVGILLVIVYTFSNNLIIKLTAFLGVFIVADPFTFIVLFARLASIAKKVIKND